MSNTDSIMKEIKLFFKNVAKQNNKFFKLALRRVQFDFLRTLILILNLNLKINYFFQEKIFTIIIIFFFNIQNMSGFNAFIHACSLFWLLNLFNSIRPDSLIGDLSKSYVLEEFNENNYCRYYWGGGVQNCYQLPKNDILVVFWV